MLRRHQRVEHLRQMMVDRDPKQTGQGSKVKVHV